MSADLLREAARNIRDDFEAFQCMECGVPESYMVGVADWLDTCAEFIEGDPGFTWDGEDHALTVARAYLGRDA